MENLIHRRSQFPGKPYPKPRLWLTRSPAPLVVRVIFAEPTPESCDKVSHDVVLFAGYTAAVHDCVLSERFTASVAVAG